MEYSILLPLILLITLAGAIATLVATPRNTPRLSGPISFVLSLIPLVLVVMMVAQFPMGTPADAESAWRFKFNYNWLPTFGVTFSMGLDSISLWLVVLTAVLTPISILASFNYIKTRQREFYAWMLALHAGMLGVFMARDILLFYL